MVKKRLLVWAVFFCMIICSKNVYAADGGRTELPEGGLHPVEAQIADEAMTRQYEEDDNDEISIQSYTSELQVYKELEGRIKSALLNGSSTVDVYDMNINRSSCSLDYYYAYSPYFFPGSSIKCWMNRNGRYVRIDLDNPLDIDQTKQYFTAVDEKLSFYKSLVDSSMSQEQKALVIHDYIVSHSEYDTTYSMFGCSGIFMSGVGVCQSYAFSYMYILNELGIEAHFVPSDSMNHAWNVVRINGKFYHVDCTYDDPLTDRFGLASHDYFLLSDNAITQKSHSGWDANGITCTSNVYDNAYWIGIESPIVPLSSDSYYVYGNYLYKRNNNTGEVSKLVEIDNDDVYQCSGLFYVDGYLFYNSSDQIRAYSLEDGIDHLVYDINEDDIGCYVDGCLLDESGSIYFSVTNGDIYELVMREGWQQSDDGWIYYVHGIPATGWMEIDSYWYYFNEDGIMQSNCWIENYYVKANGAMARNEWIDHDYYVDENGLWDSTKVSEWIQKGDKWWYKHADGSYTKAGWEYIGEYWYHFDELGWMDASKWIGNYYVKANGAMARSELVDNKYYVDENGVWDSTKVSEWIQKGDKWWYRHADGSYTRDNWEYIDGKWYYFDELGWMETSKWIGDYYVKANGAMAVDEWVDNDTCYVDINGKLVQGAKKAA